MGVENIDKEESFYKPVEILFGKCAAREFCFLSVLCVLSYAKTNIFGGNFGRKDCISYVGEHFSADFVHASPLKCNDLQLITEYSKWRSRRTANKMNACQMFDYPSIAVTFAYIWSHISDRSRYRLGISSILVTKVDMLGIGSILVTKVDMLGIGSILVTGVDTLGIGSILVTGVDTLGIGSILVMGVDTLRIGSILVMGVDTLGIVPY